MVNLREENAEDKAETEAAGDNLIVTSITPEPDIQYTVKQSQPEIDQRNQEWIQAFHDNDGSLATLYMDNALLFSSKENYIQGASAIQDFFKNNMDSFHITEFHVDYRVQLKENQKMVYETGCFVTDTDESYQYLTIWTNSNDIWLRELEAISLKDASLAIDSLIDTARDKWVEVANTHSSKNLAEELYNSDFVYYNRGNIYKGYDNLAKIYSYMNNEQYKINLSSDICIMVQPDLAYEIGTWTSNGSGNYIIIWHYKDNKWGIRLDANW